MSWLSTGDFTMFAYCEPHTDWSGWIAMPIGVLLLVHVTHIATKLLT